MRTNQIEDYKIFNAENIISPQLVVYEDIVKRNVQRLLGLFEDSGQLRPHIKTNKSPQVVQIMMDAGIFKFKCATIAEAEMLALINAPDVLLAYQPVGPNVGRFAELSYAYQKTLFSCLIDNIETAEQLDLAAKKYGVKIKVYIDLNVGMNRTGISDKQQILLLFKHCESLNNITVAGLHAYDGHLVDNNEELRLERASQCFAFVKNLTAELAVAGFKNLGIVAGSTPTLKYYATQPEVECCPGTFVYWDEHYQRSFPELPFETAAVLLARVISKPSPDAVCLDCGYKALASEGSVTERVDFWGQPAYDVISESEEHLLLSMKGNKLLPGDHIIGVPYHIGRTNHLYDQCAVVSNGKFTGYWSILARTRKLTV